MSNLTLSIDFSNKIPNRHCYYKLIFNLFIKIFNFNGGVNMMASSNFHGSLITILVYFEYHTHA